MVKSKKATTIRKGIGNDAISKIMFKNDQTQSLIKEMQFTIYRVFYIIFYKISVRNKVLIKN